MISSLSFSKSAGLTLIEMMVVVAIITIVTAIVLGGSLPAFRERTSLDLVAEEIALTVRQAQGFGVATREFGGEFPSHGIHFQSSVHDSFVLFADLPDANGNANGRYDAGEGCGASGTECRERFDLRGGVVITDVEAFSSGGSDTPDEFNIVFVRPEADAVFSSEDSGGDYSRVEITLASANHPENIRKVVVWNTGHIYACNPATQTC